MLAYQISAIPDPWDLQYRLVAGGDVLGAVGRKFENLLHSLVSLPPGSVSVNIRFLFTPKLTNGDIQSRLRIYVIAKAYNNGIKESLRLLLEGGPLTGFYEGRKIEQFEAPWEKLQSGCGIVRREDAVNPLYTSEFNDRIPPFYYTIRSFEPNDRNDYVELDRVLNNIQEAIMIDMCVEPVDITAELSEHTRYLSILQSVNRLWGRDEDEDLGLEDYFGDDSPRWRSNWTKSLKPLRYRDPLADDILRSQQRFHETLRQPHLLFHFTVLCETPAVAQLIVSVVANSAFKGGSYRLLPCSKGDNSFDDVLRSLKDIRVSALPAHETAFQGKDVSLYFGLSRLSHIATVDELLGAFRLPVASTTSPRCIPKNTDPPCESDGELFVLGLDMEVLTALRSIKLSQLCKHLFVSGGTGSGKTTSIQNLVLHLHEHDIPFLILEPVKTEYRVLKTFKQHINENARQLAEKLEVYTPGDELVSPFRFNPLSLQPGISVDEHIENMLSSFKASMPVFGPLPALLGEALERVYEDHPDGNNPPILADLVSATEQVLEEKTYVGEVYSNIKAALEVRLGVLIRRSVGKIFQCRHSVPHIEHLMEVPTVIEFDRLHTEQACLLTLFILTNIREYLKAAPKSQKTPRYVIIIEEAHNIVGKSGPTSASTEIADPKAFAAEYVIRMLAELRALGVGIVIVDQLPSAVAPEVIKNTTSKLAFRQVAQEDREELGAAMLLGPTEIEDIARLEPGQAFFFTEGYYRPRRIKTTNLHDQFDFKTLTLNTNIVPWLREDDWYQEAGTERAVNELAQLRGDMDCFDEKRLRIFHDAIALQARHAKISAKRDSKEKSRRLEELLSRFQHLKRRLTDTQRDFWKNSYAKYLGFDIKFEVKEPLVREFRDDLIDRYDKDMLSGIKKCLDLINVHISLINKS